MVSNPNWFPSVFSNFIFKVNERNLFGSVKRKKKYFLYP